MTDVVVYVEIKALIPVLVDAPGWDGDDDEEAMKLALAKASALGELCNDTLSCCPTHHWMENIDVRVAQSGPGRYGHVVVPADECPWVTS